MGVQKSIDKGKGFVRKNPILSLGVAFVGYNIWKYFNPVKPPIEIVLYSSLDPNYNYENFVKEIHTHMSGINLLWVYDEDYDRIAYEFNDNELRHVYNLFNNAFFDSSEQSLTQWIGGETGSFSDSKDDAHGRLLLLDLK